MQPTLAPAPHPMRAPASHENAADQTLREQLLAQVHSHHLPGTRQDHQLSNTPNPHQHNIDPAIAGTSIMNPGAGDSGGDENASDGRRGKRELSTSKRAAQNRSAQRAFRQRKEGHIKNLETQVSEFNQLNESYKAVQSENYQLRDYILNLQARLLESQGEYPQPPSNIDISLPRVTMPPGEHARAPTAPMRSYLADDLQASAAQAVAEHKHRHEDAPFPQANSNSKQSNQRPRVGDDVEVQTSSAPAPKVEHRSIGA